MLDIDTFVVTCTSRKYRDTKDMCILPRTPIMSGHEHAAGCSDPDISLAVYGM